MRSDGVIELTSNITDGTALDEPKPVLQDDQKPRQPSKEKASDPEPEKSPEERMLAAITGFEGGEGLFWNNTGEDKVWNTAPLDDPFAPVVSDAVARATKVKFDERLWEEEELKPEDLPDDQEDVKESGAITVTLKGVSDSKGKGRTQWKLAVEAELQSLREAGAIHTVTHVPKGKKVLPMKVVLTLNQYQELRRIKRRHVYACVVTSRRKSQQTCCILLTQKSVA